MHSLYLKETLRLKTLDLQKASWMLFIDYILQNHTVCDFLSTSIYNFKGSDQRENRRVWSIINTRSLVWGCGDGHSFDL
jgi:hypothetical protein